MPPKIKQLAAGLDKEINIFEPGPKFIGIDIGSKLVKIALIKEAPIGTRLLSIAIAEIPPQNQAQPEEDPQNRINKAIKNALKQLKINVKNVCTIINAPSVNIKNLTLPNMPEDELRESVRWEMEQKINFPLDEATTDFLVSGEKISAGAKNLELEVIAAKTEELKNHIQIYTQNQLTVQSINIPAFCLWNAFQKSNQWKEEDTTALIDIGAKKTAIYIFNNDTIKFTREILFGGDTITNKIMQDMNISRPEAEEAKIEYGLEENSIYMPSIASTVKQLISEIDRSFGYYKAQFHIERIDRLVIYGGTSQLIDLDKFLSAGLGLLAEPGNPFNGLLFEQRSFTNTEELKSFFATALGAAINSGDVKKINLLPAEFRKDPKLQLRKTLLKVIPALIIIGLIFIYTSIVNKEKVLAEKKVAHEEIIESWKTNKDFEKKLKFLNSIKVTQQNFLDIFNGISEVIPEGVWLDSIDIERSAKKLTLKGAAQSNILVIEFARKLESLNLFSNVKPPELVEERGEKEIPYIYFSIVISNK